MKKIRDFKMHQDEWHKCMHLCTSVCGNILHFDFYIGIKIFNKKILVIRILTIS